MVKKNVGKIDRALRLIAATALILDGLFGLGGWKGSGQGLLITFLGLLPLLTGLFSYCPFYTPLGISTRKR